MKRLVTLVVFIVLALVPLGAAYADDESALPVGKAVAGVENGLTGSAASSDLGRSGGVASSASSKGQPSSTSPDNPDSPIEPDDPIDSDDPNGPDDPADSDDPADPEPEVHADGWERIDGAWHYWENNEMQRGCWVKTDEAPGIKGAEEGAHRYWIAADGTLARKRLIDPADENDADAGACYYATRYGYPVTGKKVVGDHVYLARKNGKLEEGDSQGFLDTKQYDDGERQRYLIDETAHAAITGQVVKAEGWGKAYALPKKGYILRGVKKFDDSHVLVADAEGRLCQKSGWVVTSAYAGEPQRYYFEPTSKNPNVNGACTGLFKVKGWGKAYGYPKKGYIARGLRKFDGEHLLLADADGKLLQRKSPGWVSTSSFAGTSQRYWLEPTARDKGVYGARIGRFEVKDWGFAYAYPSTGYIVRGVTKFDSTHLLLAAGNGKLCQQGGFVYSSDYAGSTEQYYLEPTARDKSVYGARIGKFTIDGRSFYGEPSTGYEFRNGYKLLDGTYYYANQDGVLLKDAVTNMYSKAQNYSSPTRYLLMVDCYNTKTVVFEGWQGAWNVKFIYDCCTGAPESPTVTGVYQVTGKGESFGGYDRGYTCYYYTQFYGDYLFHTRLYYPYSNPWDDGNLVDGRMNERVSQGCVRMYTSDAYWIYENVPYGTTVVIF